MRKTRTTPSFAKEPLARGKFNRDKTELPRYAAIESEFANNVQGIVKKFQNKRLDRTRARFEFQNLLETAETHAFVAGKRSAGKVNDRLTPAEERMLDRRTQWNLGYFDKFLDDVENGAGRMAYDDRATLYAKSLWGIYNRGQSKVDWDEAENYGPNMRFYWVMDVEAEHCEGCIQRWKESRAKGGYTWDELLEMGLPGEGGTPCLVSCRCHIQPVRKRSVAEERIDDIEEQEQSLDQPEADDQRTLVPAGALEAEAPNDQQVEEQSNPERVEASKKILKSILGGDNHPLTVPVAGASAVKILPKIIDQAIDQAGDFGLEAAQQLPRALLALSKPAQLIDRGALRFYSRGPWLATVTRNENGIWELAALAFLVSEYDREQRKKQNDNSVD